MNVSLKSLLPPIDFGWNHVRARCGVSTCHNKLLTRTVPQSRIGIHMGQQWYCSPDCFAAAIEIPLAVLSRERLMDTARNPRLSLGLVMLSRGYLTEDQLRFAASESRAGEPLEDALVRLGLASDRELAAARAAQWGFPVLGHDGSGLMVQVDLPKTFLQGFAAAPVHYSPAAKRLLLGFVHQVDHSFLHAIEQIVGCRPEPCFMTPAEFEAQMQKVTAVPDYQEVVVDEPRTPAQMSRTLGGLALEVGAKQASIVRCKSWVWARLTSKRRTMDVLFAMKNATEVMESRELVS